MADYYTLTKKDFSVVREIWESNRLLRKIAPASVFSDIRACIRHRVQLPQMSPVECFMLYGNTSDTRVERFERMVGVLQALATGIVMLEAAGQNLELSGFLMRNPSADSLLFLRAFTYDSSRQIFGPSFTIGRVIGSGRPCPAVISLDDGVHGHGESQTGKLWIDNERWALLKTWLDRFLPSERAI